MKAFSCSFPNFIAGCSAAAAAVAAVSILNSPPLNQSAAQTLGLRATHLIGGLGVVALVKPAERPSTAVHKWQECLNGNSSEIRPQALLCEAVRRVDPSSCCSALPLQPQGMTSHFPIDRL